MSSDEGTPSKSQIETNTHASGRARRQKSARYNKRQAALEKLQRSKLTGSRANPDEEQIDDLYETVDEEEYSRRVEERLEDDWIEDDGTGDYIDDGREIFDDETAENRAHNRREQQKKQAVDAEKAARKAAKKKTISKMVKSGDIQKMLSAAKRTHTTTKKEAFKKDDMLDDIMGELGGSDDVTEEPKTYTHHRKPVARKQTPSTSSQWRKPQLKKRVSTSSVKQNRPQQVKMSPAKPPPPLNRKPIEEPVEINDEFETEMMEMPDDFDSVEPMEHNSPPEKKIKLEAEQPAASESHHPDFDDDDFADIDFDDDILESDAPVPKKEIKIEPKQPKQEWDGELKFQNVQQQTNNIPVQHGKLPVKTENGEQVLKFFWLDAYEDQYKQPGCVYLFGKVHCDKSDRYLSCTVVVKNIDRMLYLLPKEKGDGERYEMSEVYQEVNEDIESKYGLKVSSRDDFTYKTKMPEMRNVFAANDVPRDKTQYLQISYPAKYGRFHENVRGKTFSHVFGNNSSALELLLLERKIRGPSWLTITKFVSKAHSGSFMSHSKFEVEVNSPKSVTVDTKLTSVPPLSVLTINLVTVPNHNTNQNEIVGIAGLIHNAFPVDKPAPKPAFNSTFFALTKPKNCLIPFDFKDEAKKKNYDVTISMNEKDLLKFFLAKLAQIDPDVIMGHDLVDFTLDVLLTRMSKHNVDNWSRLGRLKRKFMPKLKGFTKMVDRLVTSGRVLCDLKMSAKELIRCRSYDLTTLAQHVLNQGRMELKPELVPSMYKNLNSLIQLVDHTLVDAKLALDLTCELQALPLALQITSIAGNVLSRTLMGGRAERNEFLLLHAFHELSYIAPEKIFKKKETKQDTAKAGNAGKPKKKAAYEGGLVLAPKKGFYDKYILLLDFNSLYPSIIQEYNICFTTLETNPPEGHPEDELYIPEVPEQGLDAGVLPTEIRKLVERRRAVKQMMKGQISKEQYTQYDIRQKALKLTANSMYGCLGFQNSRFYAKPLAALVTRRGREILMNTKELAQKMGLEVIYGDTDSIMINTNSTDMDNAFRLGNQVKAEVNKLYRLLEIDIDGVYKSLLLLKKKKYAALSVQKSPNGTYETKKELKGLDIVRRDWCDLAKDAGNFAVDQILSNQQRETIVEKIHEMLNEVGTKVKEGTFSLDKYVIRKELTRDPEMYPGKDNLPHVRVAMRANKVTGQRKMRSGDVVAYVICQDGTENTATQRSYTLEELNNQDNLKVDCEYYLANQVHPVVSRLCDPIQETDPAMIAQCLGLDASGFKQRMRRELGEDDEDDHVTFQTEEERYSGCHGFVYRHHGDIGAGGDGNVQEFEFSKGLFVDLEPSWQCTLAQPCGEKLLSDCLVQIMNQLTMAIRKDINKYYQGWTVCDDPACGHRTRSAPNLHDNRGLVCTVCYGGILKSEYSYRDLYQQLCFYKLQFDVDYALRKYKKNNINSNANVKVQKYKLQYRKLTDVVDTFLQMNGYNNVSLASLFSWMSVNRSGKVIKTERVN